MGRSIDLLFITRLFILTSVYITVSKVTCETSKQFMYITTTVYFINIKIILWWLSNAVVNKIGSRTIHVITITAVDINRGT